MQVRRPDRRVGLGSLASTGLLGCTRSRLGCSVRPACLLLTLALALGCAGSAAPKRSENGVTHTVRAGETVWRIAKHYGVPLESVIRANRIRNVTQVPIGAKLWIPEAASVSSRGPVLNSAQRKAMLQADLAFRWPLKGQLTSRYGRRRGRPHEGIDLAAPQGTPVFAAEAGKVIYSGSGLGDYGNVVIVKHAGYYSTVYAHNRRNRVRRGRFVEKGEVVAEVGATGNASGPHLHFEIRLRREPKDPLSYLP